MIGAPEEQPIRIIRWLFYAFVLSLPFETAAEGLLEPTTILGALLLASTLLQPGVFLRWPPKGFWCFIVYFYLFVLSSVLEPGLYRGLTIKNLFLLAQLTILCWIAFSILRHEDVAERALLTFGGGCALLALLQISGVVGRVVEVEASIHRFTAFGFHPNNLARILILGQLALIGLCFGRGRSWIRSLLIAGPAVVILTVAMLQTGSRGGLLALCLGLATFVIRGKTMTAKVVNILGLFVLLVVLAGAVLTSDVMRARFESTVESGDVARRDLIYPTAWQMFLERPIFGWGPVNSTYVLGNRLGHIDEETKNPHNIFLFGLVSTGIVGSLPLVIGLGFAIMVSWRARNRSHSVLPFAMVMAVMVANMSGLWLFSKLHWLVMAYGFASAYYSVIKPSLLQLEDDQDELAREYVTI